MATLLFFSPVWNHLHASFCWKCTSIDSEASFPPGSLLCDIEEKSAKSFKGSLTRAFLESDYMLETVLKKEQENCYATLVSATGSSLLDGYLETHNLSFC